MADYMVFWLQSGVMHAVAACRGIAGGVAMNRIVMHRTARDKTADVWCVICRDNDPQEVDTAENLHVSRIAVRPNTDEQTAQERAAAHARQIFRPGPSEDAPRSQLGIITKPTPLKFPDLCTCGHQQRDHDTTWVGSFYCEECDCNDYTPVAVDPPCQCGDLDSQHRNRPYDGLRWCNVTGCSCLDFTPPGKLRRRVSAIFDDIEEPTPIVLPDPVGYVSPGYEDEEAAA